MVLNGILIELPPEELSADFDPARGMRNRHLMTILASRLVRPFPDIVGRHSRMLVPVEEGSHILIECNFASDVTGSPPTSPPEFGTTSAADSGNVTQSRPAVILVHGLEGSAQSHYLLGLSRKFLAAGFDTIRMNMRNCGGTLHLSRTLYNAGLSADVVALARYLIKVRRYDQIYFVGFSLGGNMVLKAAAELANRNATWLKGVCAISPSIDLHACVDEIEKGFNRIYERNFLRGLREKILAKNKLFPGKYSIRGLKSIQSIRLFDDLYTAPDGGYSSVSDYYTRASALPMVAQIKVPTMVIAAKDDPIVPFRAFESLNSINSSIKLLAPQHGGHAGFIGYDVIGHESSVDRYWAENQVVRFCTSHSRTA